MPRAQKSVKRKTRKSPVKQATSLALDLHFHGLFGVDLMQASSEQLESLETELYRKGVQAYLPTTLSSPPSLFEAALARLGNHIQNQWGLGPRPRRAFPLGIHLEGPFLAQSCCGAHPVGFLLPPDLKRLKYWWELSSKTLARITLAPELGSPREVKNILRWCQEHSVSVALGHSHVSFEEAKVWHQAGIRQLTHAWNAMPFHHRNPGPLGAYLGQKNTWIEIIPDGTHVHDEVLKWTHVLHPQGVFWVSDGVPGGLSGKPASFGTLEVNHAPHEPVCRTPAGALAGGALPLSELARRALKRGLLPHLGASQLHEFCWQSPWNALGSTPQRNVWKKRIERVSRSS